MNVTTPTRQEIAQFINEIQDDLLPELANFLEYLRFKNEQLTRDKPATENNFLIMIAGLGESEETDLSERDEEILAQENDPIYGFYQGEKQA